jgi:hypothetical protein
MSEPRTLRCYEYVNRPYDDVRVLLQQRALEVFQRATTSAAERANALAATLRVGVAGVEIGVDVRIEIGAILEDSGPAGAASATRVPLSWKAAQASGLFPAMSGRLSVWPLSASETQIEIDGEYRPPMGVVGSAFDAAVGHRIAEASVKRFLDDVVEQIRRELREKK